ncbi:transcription termination/antitermination protein NusG [Hymenobacter qilianensis]|jgi:transcriptional antiterminator NusG|uniref:Transcription termination/antitermination protein NusG n=2 Tax=Hymenobacter qilianensis TaxID=1385715 RepID=A0ACB5PM86_9BACT|nr:MULTISPECIES: transcription termination/antitermination protein NusG [Hymenobacter]MBC6606296.1 transcription termination/antitermination factor NusG [Hymenobacter sp. BT188]QIL75980.1 transcription termination/antitermination factor NusG [Hymenobacter sp. HDW8]QNP53862.1 transcription termination/antitermination factor NusG [Hymenobacter qilianensis]GGF52435.1 transcription termination/antitermination protein NusG [Hymenobacter qilianensis]
MGELKWYVVRSVSGQEKKAKQYLETELGRHNLTEMVPQVLIPIEKVFEMRNGKKRVRERNLYPGYIIIHADLTHGEVDHIITSTPGVIGWVGDKDSKTASSKPAPLHISEVNRILGIVDEQEEQTASLETPFITGELVKVIDGAFSGFSGTVSEVFEERKKLNVIVKIFGRSTPMELSYTQVEKES